MQLRPVSFLALSPLALATVPACSSGGGDAPAPTPPAATSISLQGAGQPGGGLGGLTGPGNGPGLGAPGNNAPGLGAPGNAPPTPPVVAGGFAANRPSGGTPAATPTPAAGGDITSLFFAKPSAGVKPSETIHGAGGVFAGLPTGWGSTDLNSDGYTDQCVHLYPKSESGKPSVCLKTMSGVPNQTDLRREAYGVHWDKAEFDGWSEGKAGFLGYSAKIAHGKGTSVVKQDGDREGYAVYVTVPGKKNVLVLGSWPLQYPNSKQTFLDIVRGVGTCTFKPQKGCVADRPYDG